jgi:hypothetical protein
MLFPSEHLRLLVQFLGPNGPELCRRWLAVLAMVAPIDREALVAEMERRAAALYPPETLGPASSPATADDLGGDTSPSEVHVVYPPVQRAGYTEQVGVVYTPGDAKPATARAKKAKRA